MARERFSTAPLEAVTEILPFTTKTELAPGKLGHIYTAPMKEQNVEKENTRRGGNICEIQRSRVKAESLFQLILQKLETFLCMWMFFNTKCF